jgi:hypothetical protein
LLTTERTDGETAAVIALINGSYAPSARYANVVPESTIVPCVFDVANKEESMVNF